MALELDLKTHLKRLEKTPYWLAKETGIPYDTINRLVKGKAGVIRLSNLEKISEALECSPCDLIVSRSGKKSAKH
jgi:DNA-binding Xre family transcriptional regulator